MDKADGPLNPYLLLSFWLINQGKVDSDVVEWASVYNWGPHQWSKSLNSGAVNSYGIGTTKGFLLIIFENHHSFLLLGIEEIRLLHL